MAGVYSNITLHIVLSTRWREPSIDGALEPRLHHHLNGLVRAEGCIPYEINGMPDHVHLLLGWPPDVAVSDLVSRIKRSSARWVRETFRDRLPVPAFAWAQGYCVFTTCLLHTPLVARSIRADKDRHKNISFADELRTLLRNNKVLYDEGTLFD